jgi:hypothetical protein
MAAGYKVRSYPDNKRYRPCNVTQLVESGCNPRSSAHNHDSVAHNDKVLCQIEVGQPDQKSKSKNSADYASDETS